MHEVLPAQGHFRKRLTVNVQFSALLHSSEGKKLLAFFFNLIFFFFFFFFFEIEEKLYFGVSSSLLPLGSCAFSLIRGKNETYCLPLLHLVIFKICK